MSDAKRLTAREILIAGLKAGGYDGLSNLVEPCGCGLDDLCPCGGDNMDLDGCVAARRATCDHVPDDDVENYDCGGDCDDCDRVIYVPAEIGEADAGEGEEEGA